MAKILLRNALFGEKWTPKKLQNSLKFWYDAADISTITPNVGNVTQMLDKSGNGFTLTPPYLAIGPITGTRTLNGLNVLEYVQSVGYLLENTSFAQSQPLCIAFALRLDDEGITGDQDFVFSGTESVTHNNVTSTVYYVNSIGEGCILISNYGGEIQNGDYITTCPIGDGGYGSLQTDDIIHSYTVAKCTEDIVWSSITETISYNSNIYKIYLASCTYHCG